MKYLFSDTAWTDYLYWQQQDKKTLKKINNLLEIGAQQSASNKIPELSEANVIPLPSSDESSEEAED